MLVDELAAIGAALSEPGRLRILALLARRPHYAEELAEASGLHPATISHHLRRLRECGLVEVERRAPYRLIHLDRENWDGLIGRLQDLDNWAESFGMPDEERISGRLLQRYLDGAGKVVRLPRQARPLDIVLRHLLEGIDTGRVYPRREVLLHLIDRCDDAEAALEALERRGWLAASGSALRRIQRKEDA